MMLFQFPLTQPGGQIQSVMWTLQQWGLLDALLPFLLLFAILFGALQKIALFKIDANKPDRKMNAILSFVIAAMVVVPHITRSYPQNMDPVTLILNFLPATGVLMIVLFLVLVLLGLVATQVPTQGMQAAGFFALVIFGLVVLSTIYPTVTPDWLRVDPNTQALLITLLVFALVVAFIVREPGVQPPPNQKSGFWKFLEEINKP